MASHANRLNNEARTMVRKLVAKNTSGPMIRRALEAAGHPSDFSGSLLSYYRARPEIKPRRNAACVSQVHTRALVLHGADGRRGVLAVDDKGVLSWTPDTGAAQPVNVGENTGRGEQ